MITTVKQWHAVYTRSKCEKKVADLLTRKNIESYCPLNRILRQWADRKKIVFEPLFSSYVFVNITPAQYVELKQTDGVINLVYWLGKPAVIRDEEIDIIKRFLESYKYVTLEKVNVNIHDTVRIIGGALVSQEGKVLEVMNNTIKVLLPTLGYHMLAEIEKTNIEIVKSAGTLKRLSA